MPNWQQEHLQTKHRLTFLNNVVIGLLVVVSFIVIGFVMDYWARQQNSYQDLVDQVHETNIKLDLLMQLKTNTPDILNRHL